MYIKMISFTKIMYNENISRNRMSYVEFKKKLAYNRVITFVPHRTILII